MGRGCMSIKEGSLNWNMRRYRKRDHGYFILIFSYRQGRVSTFHGSCRRSPTLEGPERIHSDGDDDDEATLHSKRSNTADRPGMESSRRLVPAQESFGNLIDKADDELLMIHDFPGACKSNYTIAAILFITSRASYHRFTVGNDDALDWWLFGGASEAA